MRTAENVMAAWALVQRGALSMEYNENNRSLWSFRFDENALVVKIHDLEGVIALLDEMVRASAPVRDSFMKIVEASGYEPEGLMFSKLDMASISKFAWVGEYLAQNGKRVEIVLEDQLLVAVGNDTKPGLLGLTGLKHVEIPKKMLLLNVLKKLQPVLKRVG